MESQPLTCELGGHLRFQVAGYLGWENQSLALRDLRTGEDVPVTAPRLPRERWVDATVPCPRGPFQIVAIDETEGSWFGFREPVETGWASIAAAWLIRHSREPLIVLLTMVLFTLVVRWP